MLVILNIAETIFGEREFDRIYYYNKKDKKAFIALRCMDGSEYWDKIEEIVTESLYG